MSPLLLAVALLLAGAQTPAQTNEGAIEGRMLRNGSLEPLSDVQVTLVAPPPTDGLTNLSPEAAAALSTRISSLVSELVRAGASQEVIDNSIATAQRDAGGVAAAQNSALTDSMGHFAFRNLAPGKYTVRAQREGYFGPLLNGTAQPSVSTAVTIQAGKPVSTPELFLTRGGIISGRVRGPNGLTVAGAGVAAYRLTYTNGRPTWSLAGSKTTDDRGDYRIFWLPPGEYYIGVTPSNGASLGTTGVPGPQDTWLRTFFPGTIDPTTAAPILIKEGSESNGIDINIQSGAASMFKVSGTAVISNPRPNPSTGVADPSVSSFVLSPREPGLLDTANPPSTTNAIPAGSRTHGEFEIRNVRPGAYDLYPLYMDSGPPAAPSAPSPPAARNQRYLVGPITPVEVVRGDVTGVSLVVNPGITLSGEVLATGSGEQPIKFDLLRIILRSQSTMPDAFAGLVGALQVDAAGKFTGERVPESKYTFQLVGMPNTAYIADVLQGGVSVFDTGFTLSESSNRLQIILDAGGITVEGSVQTKDRKPAANATVVLVPPTSRRKNALMYKNATVDDSGHFTIRGVPPGEYTVFAWDSVLPTAWQNAEFLSKYQDRGRPLNVAPLSHPSIELESIAIEADH